MSRNSLKKSVLLAAVALSLLLPAAKGAAYSKEGHERLTRAAVALARACSRVPSAQVADTLVDYNVAQDDVFRKMRLWHFPYTPAAFPDCDPCRDQCYSSWCPYWFDLCAGAVYRAFDPWLGYLLASLARGLTPDQHYPALGALLHYLQDLAVPAHAVPIFHPEWLLGHDDFDDYAFAIDTRAMQKPPAELCAQVQAGTSPAGLFQDMRAQTLASLEHTFVARAGGRPVKLPWSLFWRSASRREGAPEFGSYGCDPGFGAARVRCEKREYEVAQSSYEEYARERARAAIVASAALILLSERAMKPCPRASCRPQDDDERWLPSKGRLEALRGKYCAPLAQLPR